MTTAPNPPAQSKHVYTDIESDPKKSLSDLSLRGTINPLGTLEGLGKFLELIPARCWIAGGAVVNTFLGIPNRDVDVYFPTREELLKGVWWFAERGATCTAWHSKVVKIEHRGTSIDLIQANCSNVSDTLAAFDLEVCRMAVIKGLSCRVGYTCYPMGDDRLQLYQTEQAQTDLIGRVLRINNSENPPRTIARVGKYGAKGFALPLEEAKKLADACVSKKPKGVTWAEAVLPVEFSGE